MFIELLDSFEAGLNVHRKGTKDGVISCEEITNGSGNSMHISLFSDLFEAICLRPDGLTDEIEI